MGVIMNNSKSNYVICWFDKECNATIVGIMVERNGRSDNEWTSEKVKVEKMLQRGLDR